MRKHVTIVHCLEDDASKGTNLTLHERWGTRDLTYSRWHRPDSISRYIPYDDAGRLDMIDLDAIEVCHDCRQPLMLLELARDVGQPFKATTILRELALRSQVPAALCFYTVDGSNDIARFRLRSVEPPRADEHIATPAQYARWLLSLRTRHCCHSSMRGALTVNRTGVHSLREAK